MKKEEQQYFKKFLDDYYNRFNQLRIRYHNGYSPKLYDQLSTTFTQIDKEFENLHKKLTHEEIDAYHNYMKEHPLHTIFREAPFMDKVYSKPLGYAGDFSMMLDIYENGFQGTDKFSMELHHASVNTAGAKAVRGRLAVMNKYLNEAHQKKGKKNILNLGCGPCYEIPHFYFCNYGVKRNATFHLVDQDKNALAYAKNNLKQYDAKFIQVKIADFFKKIKEFDLPKMDLIYSAGLFDYLPEKFAQFAIARTFDLLKKNGKMVIGNFNPTNPTKGSMEIIGDWKLIYRTKQELERLLALLPGNYRFEIESDETKINSFLVIKKI
jgi:hypothetical protein